MAIDVNEIDSEDVKTHLAINLGVDDMVEEDESLDRDEELNKKIEGMEAFEVLDAYLQGNGILGYTRDILTAVQQIDAASGGELMEDK